MYVIFQKLFLGVVEARVSAVAKHRMWIQSLSAEGVQAAVPYTFHLWGFWVDQKEERDWANFHLLK